MTTQAPTRSSHPPDGRFAAFLLVGLAAALYAGTLGYGFVFDDYLWIVDNPAIRSLRTALGSFGAGQVANHHYRPLALLWFALDYAAAGLSPWLYHLENVLLHAGVCLAVLALFRRIAPASALVAAALFAVLPVHTEAVANVVSRSELMAALFGLLTLLMLHRPLLAGLFLLLALFSKESAIAVPLLALLLAASPKSRAQGQQSSVGDTVAPGPWTLDISVVRVMACLAVVAGVYLALYHHALGHFRWPRYPMLELGNPLAFAGTLTRLRTAVMILGQNLALCFVPYHFSADYSAPQIPLVTSWVDARWLAWGGLAAAAMIVAVVARRRRPVLTVGIAWFFIAIAPVSNLFMPIGTIRGERLLYLPSAGACLVLAECLVWLGHRRKAFAVVLMVLALAGNAALTVARSRVWRDMPAITAATVLDAPDSAKAHFDLAAMRARIGEHRAAIPEFERALELWPEFNQARLALGECWVNAGDPGRGLSSFRQASAREPGNSRILSAIATVCGNMGEWGCAAESIVRLMAVDRDFRESPAAWADLARAYDEAGRRPEAESARAEAARRASAGKGAGRQ